jgi:serine/threonine protein kinase
MGEVFLAHQLNLNRRVAIKVISREWINSFEDDTKAISSSLERFRREVQVMAQVRHPNILQIQDHGTLISETDGEIDYIVIEYAPGGNLRSTMSGEGFYPEEDRARHWISHYFLPLLDGVKALHQAGIIHRDLKPENVLLCENIPKIADFGLARSSHFQPITQSIEMQGTPFYMSPEHYMDLKRTDERTDIYALGKILYEAISGKAAPEQVPFRKAALERTETPFFEAIDLVIQSATEENREERLPTVQSLMDALGSIVPKNGPGALPFMPDPAKALPNQRSRLFTAAVVLTVSAAVGLVTFAYERGNPIKTTTEVTLPQLIQAQPEPAVQPGDHFYVVDHDSASQPDVEPSPLSQQNFSGVRGDTSKFQEATPPAEAAQLPSAPAVQSPQPAPQEPKTGNARQKKKVHSTAKTRSSSRIAKSRREPRLPYLQPETRVATRPPRQSFYGEDTRQPPRAPEFPLSIPWPIPSGANSTGNANGDGC